MTNSPKSATWIHDPYWPSDGHHFADQVHQEERPEFSRLLGPDGKPLKYEKHPMGFDLRKKPS